MELFGGVKKGPRVNMEFTAKGPFWKPGKLYRLEAVKDVHILDLTWTLPCLRKEYLKKPEDYIAHLLGHGKRLRIHNGTNNDCCFKILVGLFYILSLVLSS